jgi:dihydrofolate reductase
MASSALRQARAAAGAKNVSVGAANTAQQLLKAGLVEEVHIHLVPILLGAGTRLFEDVGTEHTLANVRVIEAPGVTHLAFRVTK